MPAGCFQISSNADYLKTCESGRVFVKCFSLLNVISQRYINQTEHIHPAGTQLCQLYYFNSF